METFGAFEARKFSNHTLAMTYLGARLCAYHAAVLLPDPPIISGIQGHEMVQMWITSAIFDFNIRLLMGLCHIK